MAILQDQTPISLWKLCKIEEFTVGNDGMIRAVKIRTSNGNTLRRPIEHLYPLEIRSENEISNEGGVPGEAISSVPSTPGPPTTNSSSATGKICTGKAATTTHEIRTMAKCVAATNTRRKIQSNLDNI